MDALALATSCVYRCRIIGNIARDSRPSYSVLKHDDLYY
jgi:hypothetical protein